MSTHVTIVKKPSGHNLQVAVNNPGDASHHVYTLTDNQAVEVMIHGGFTGGVIELREIDKLPVDKDQA